MKEILLNSIKLCIITLISGLLLGAVYEVTKAPRKEQEKKSKQEAYEKVLNEADSFEEISFDETDMEKYLADNGTKKSVAGVDEVVAGKDSSGNVIGYVITVTDSEGYGGDVQFAVGFKNDGTITGISFLTLQETAGVGMKANQSKFKNQFAGKKVDSFVYTKNGAKEDNEIDAMSGATITTNAVTNGVNASILGYKFIAGDSESETGGEANE